MRASRDAKEGGRETSARPIPAIRARQRQLRCPDSGPPACPAPLPGLNLRLLCMHQVCTALQGPELAGDEGLQVAPRRRVAGANVRAGRAQRQLSPDVGQAQGHARAIRPRVHVHSAQPRLFPGAGTPTDQAVSPERRAEHGGGNIHRGRVAEGRRRQRRRRGGAAARALRRVPRGPPAPGESFPSSARRAVGATACALRPAPALPAVPRHSLQAVDIDPPPVGRTH